MMTFFLEEGLTFPFLYYTFDQATLFHFFSDALLFMQNMWVNFAPFPLWLEHLNLIWVIEMAGIIWLVFEENFPKAFLYINLTVLW